MQTSGYGTNAWSAQMMGAGQQHQASKSAKEIGDELRQRSEYTSTVLSIFIGLLNTGLHVAVAWYAQTYYFGFHQAFWAFIVLGLVANLVGIILYVTQHADDGESSGPSEFSVKLQERQNEAVLYLAFGIVNTETLCFLTPSERSHAIFRKLTLLTGLFQDIPILGLSLHFMTYHGFYAQPLVFFVMWETMLSIILKGLRFLIILATSGDTTPAQLALFKNLRLEDLVLIPLQFMYWVVLLVLLHFLDFAAYDPDFAQQWLTRQLLSLGTFDDALALNVSLVSESLQEPLRTAADQLLNATAYGNVDTLTVDALIRGVILPAGAVSTAVLSAAEDVLTPDAYAFLGEWQTLQGRLDQCFKAGAVFLAAGAITTVALLYRYLSKKELAASFRSEVLWRDSLTCALVASLAIAVPSVINAITQDKRGYSMVKRDSSAVMILFYGLPMGAVAAAALRGFNCWHRECGELYYQGRDAEYYTIFALVLACPILWWQVLSLMTAIVGLRSAEKESEKGNAATQDDLDAEAAAKTPLSRKTSVVLSLLLSILVWSLQLCYLMICFWNSPLATVTIGGQPARDSALATSAYGRALDLGSANPSTYVVTKYESDNVTIESETDVAYDPPLPWEPQLTSTFFTGGVAVWLLAFLINVIVLGLYVAHRGSSVIRRSIEENLAPSAFMFSLAGIAPEVMCALSTHRSDVMMARALGLLPAILLDMPIVVSSATVLYQIWYFHPFVMAVLWLSSLHLFLYTYRSAVVLLTAPMRRPAASETLTFAFLESSDMLTLLTTAVQVTLVSVLCAAYWGGFYYGTDPEMVDQNGNVMDHIESLRVSFYLVVVILAGYLLSNLAVCISVLNHWQYSNTSFSENSFRTALIMLAGTLDPYFLNILTEDHRNALDIKQLATRVAITTFYAPMLVLEVVIIFMVDVEWDVYDLNAGSAAFPFAVPGQLITNLTMTTTVLLGVWKLLRGVVIQTSLKEAAEPTKFFHALPLSEQWYRNRKPPEGWSDGQTASDGWGSTVTGARHRYGYAVDELGNYVLDELGEYMLADGVEYALDEYGQYQIDAEGNYVLSGLMPSLNTAEGYDQGGADQLTNTSRSTDTYADPYAAGADQAGLQAAYDQQAYDNGTGASAADYPIPGAMVQIRCLQRAIFMTPDGYQGIFVSVAPTPDNPSPFMFVQVHNIEPLKKPRFGSKGAQVQCSYLSVDVGGYDREYVERNLSNDPDAAWRTLQMDTDVDAGLTVDALDPYYEPPADSPAPLMQTPDADARTAAAQQL